MKSIKVVVFLLLLLTQFSVFSQSLYEVPVEEITNKSSLIVEGKVVGQTCFWNTQHTMIYTENKILVYKSFKGTLTSDIIKVITVGGQVGTSAIVASDLLDLNLNDIGLFYCTPNTLSIKSPQDQSVLLDVYSSQQGFVKYDLNTLSGSTPFKKYSSITNNLYQAVEAKTGGRFKTIHPWSESPEQFRATTISALGISSFSPTTVNAGALLDPTNNLLTITGTDFGTASGSAAVYFDDANNGTGGTPWTVAYNDPLIVSWSATEIKIRVPQRAGTGTIGVTNSDGSSVNSSTSLTVRYSVMTFGFSYSGTSYVKEANLMNSNTLGGYTIKYSTNTAGSGVDLDASAAKATFQRALNTWKEISGYNITEGGTTTNQAIADDGINTIVYDNLNTGISPLAAGVLGVCYSYFNINATYVSDYTTNQGYKVGFDISIRNTGVSSGTSNFTLGPCPPNSTDYTLIDLETVLLHEIGHSIGLGHINDGNVGSSIGEINPGKLMHYSVVNSTKRVSPDYSAYAGATYLIQPQGNTYGGSNTEMTPLSTTLESKDDCPTTLPSTALATSTAVSFDMVHTTSNSLTDPEYTNITCDGYGASLTNNAYYAFKTGSTASSTLTITVSGYGTIPAALASCTQAYSTIPVTGFRLALYNVSGGLPTSPSGYGSPVACKEFTANGAISDITGLAANTEYLIFIEGIENTKAAFDLTFTGTATATASASNTAGTASSTPTLCINTALTNITHTTTGATGIGTATGLPAGVTAAWASNLITISGTPTASGTFSYSIPLTGGTGSVNATGTITVTITAAPTTANAGPDQTGSGTCGSTTSTLAGNTASVGTGAWSIVSGTGGTITTPSSATSTFSGTAGSSYTLRWTISNGSCTASTDDVVITFNANATPIIGTYAGTSIKSGQNATITPSAAPSYTTSIIAYSNTDFNGTFTVNPTTGVLTVNNAKHAGSYPVTVKAYNSGGCTSTTTFTLTVSNTVLSPGVFPGIADVNVGTDATSLAIGDFNEDGNQDFVAANEGSASVSVRLGNGSGSFSGSTNVSVGNNPRSIAIGDFNKDGHLDIATANAGSSSVSIRLGNGSGAFSGSTELTVGYNTSSIALGDFNKDGALDIVTADPEPHSCSVLLGDGNGGFGGRTEISVGDYPFSVAVGDFNGDGNPDFAALNYFGGDVSLRLGDGNGSFSNGTDVSVESDARSLAIGDFNGDGKQDFATTAQGSATVSIRLGDGIGGFSGSTSISVESQPWFVTVGDFNGDGKQDFATANNNANSVSIRLGDGNGDFSGSTNLYVDDYPRGLAIGDFNGDGKQDIAAARISSINGVSIFLGGDNDINIKGNAVSITDGDNSPSTSDNTDFGSTCIAGTISKTFTIENTGTVALQLNSGSITVTGTNASMFAVGNITLPASIAAGSSSTFTVTFTPSTVGTKTATIHIASDDVDEADYDFAIQGAAVTTIPAVALGTYNATSVILSQNTTITPTAAPSNSTAVFAYSTTNFGGTLTVNSTTGVLSVTNAKQAGTFPVTLKASNSVGCSVNTTFNLTVTTPPCSKGTFTGTTDVNVGSQTTAVSIGDFNGDGKQDIVSANEGTNTVSIRLGNGSGGFSGTTEVTVGDNPRAVAVGDFNGDGNQDIASANAGSSSVSIRFGNGSGDFSGSTELSVGVHTTSIALGDFNKDGALDIVTADPDPHSCSVLLGNGNGGFGGRTEISVGDYPTSVAVGDFNGDGNPDFAASNYFGDDISILLGDGNGGFSNGTNVSVGGYPRSLAIGDFNGDGNQDFATTAEGNAKVSIRLGNGSGGFSGSTSISVRSEPWFITVGDFNGDGKQDFATANNNAGSVSIRIGDGNGNFIGIYNKSVGSNPRSVAIGDFNGDGNQDFAAANSGSDMLSILLGDANEINIKGNAVSIVDGDISPSTTDDTDFGNSCATGTIVKTFTIENTGTAALQLNSGAITVAGTNASMFTVAGITLPKSIEAGSSTTFTVTFTASSASAGNKTATIHVASNDCDEADYDFAVQATVNAAPTTANAGTDQTGASTCGLTSVTLAGNTASIGTGAWSIVSGTGGTITTPSSPTSTFTGTAGSSYTLRWTISNALCTASTDDVVITFNQAPTAGITNNSSTTVLTCTTSTISLTATGGVSYSWSNGTSVVGTNAALSVMIPATYTVTVTGASGCTATSAVTITQTGSVPTIAIANSAGTTELSCTNKTITLTASGSSYYYWTKNGVIVSTDAALTVSTSGTYIATGTAGSGGCSGSNLVTITQNATLPVAAITNNTGATQVDCTNAAISLTATGGTSYLWSDGSTSATLSVSAAGTYTVTVTNSGSGCTSTSSIAITKNISASTAATLSGSTTITSGGSANLKVAITGGQAPFTVVISNGSSTITTSNYYPLKPTIAVSPTSTTNYTLVSVTGSNGCAGTGNSGTAAVVTVNTPGTTSWTGTVSRLWNVGGNWSTGTIPNENDAITIGTNTNQPQLNIDFTVGGSLTLSGTGTTLTVNAGKSLSVASGATVDFGSKEVTFKSDATGTAQLGRMQGTLSNASNVVVERYFPATNRAYRFISASATTTGSMKFNWMEDATAGTTAGYPFAAGTATNPTAGYGTQITGTGGNTNGFDATGTNNASIFSLNNASQAWSAVANTSGTLNAGDAYRILIRGDRGINLNSSAPAVTATTLRTRGTLKTGTHTVSSLSSAWGGWNLIGNPYNAQIDMRGVSATNMTASYTVWDPTRGTRGAYVVYNYGTGVSSNFGSAVNELLQPGQAFFVQTDNPGAATFTFEEVDKTPAGTQTSVFSPLNVYPVLNSALYYTDSLAKNKPEMDAFAVVFDNNFSDAIDREDGQKYPNSDENMSVKRNGSLLALELRSMYNGGTEIPISITNYIRQNYTMRLKWNNPANAGYDAKLVDNYNGTETAINFSGNTDYVYTVNSSIPGSIAADRFKIVFVPNAALPVSGLTLTGAAKGNAVALQYEALNERDMQVYDIERSADGAVFNKLGEQQPVNGTAVKNRYNYTDNNPLAGVNYYRIKGSSINGQLQYSNVITVKTGSLLPTVTVAPNPIANKVLNLKLSQLTKGSYRMTVTDVAGRTIYSKEMVYDGVSSAIKTSLPSNLKPGNYYVRLSGEGSDFTEKFIIQ